MYEINRIQHEHMMFFTFQVPMITNEAPSTVSSMVLRASLRKRCGLTLEASNGALLHRHFEPPF